MKAILFFNPVLNIMTLKVDDMFIYHEISDVMTKIYELSDYEDGFLTYQTNYGEEYTDFYEIISSGR